MAVIYWNGKSSDDVNVVVEKYPPRTVPKRKSSKTSIDGRSGDVLFVQNAFENYTQKYEVYLSAEKPGLPKVAHAAADWLYSGSGYLRLEDDYDIDTFRMAAFTGPADVENIFNRWGRASLEFDCKPQRFFKTGEREIQIQSGDALRNPSVFPAEPVITIHGTGAGVLHVGSYTVNILSLSDLVLDCETQNAYYGVTNLNSTIATAEFPKLDAGETVVTWSGLIETVKIIPRWWTV